MSRFIWENDKYSLANPALDQHHQEFVELVDACIQSSDAEFIELFGKLLEHTKEHFDEEDSLMEQYDFPERLGHMEEHQRVLAEMRRLVQNLDAQNCQNAQDYVAKKMPEWFALHTLTMDNDLVAYIMKKKI